MKRHSCYLFFIVIGFLFSLSSNADPVLKIESLTMLQQVATSGDSVYFTAFISQDQGISVFKQVKKGDKITRVNSFRHGLFPAPAAVVFDEKLQYAGAMIGEGMTSFTAASAIFTVDLDGKTKEAQIEKLPNESTFFITAVPNLDKIIWLGMGISKERTFFPVIAETDRSGKLVKTLEPDWGHKNLKVQSVAKLSNDRILVIVYPDDDSNKAQVLVLDAEYKIVKRIEIPEALSIGMVDDMVGVTLCEADTKKPRKKENYYLQIMTSELILKEKMKLPFSLRGQSLLIQGVKGHFFVAEMVGQDAVWVDRQGKVKKKEPWFVKYEELRDGSLELIPMVAVLPDGVAMVYGMTNRRTVPESTMDIVVQRLAVP